MSGEHRTRLVELVRTNGVLILLCFISIALLIILLRGTSVGYDPSQSRRDDFEALSSESTLRASPLRHLPSSDTFTVFTYSKGKALHIEGLCRDVYYVVMIFPQYIDYRIDPLSAKYNASKPCAGVSTYDEQITLDGMGLIPGDGYYVVKAHEGRKGMWYDPY